MAVRPIRIIGDPVLHNPTRPVTSSTRSCPRSSTTCSTRWRRPSGVGLAANQVGVDLRVFVFDCADEMRRPTAARGGGQPGAGDLADARARCRTRTTTRRAASRCPGSRFPTGRADWARVARRGRRRRAGRRGGPRLPGPLPAARDRPPRRGDLPRPAGRAGTTGRRKQAVRATAGACRGCAGTPPRWNTRSGLPVSVSCNAVIARRSIVMDELDAYSRTVSAVAAAVTPRVAGCGCATAADRPW